MEKLFTMNHTAKFGNSSLMTSERGFAGIATAPGGGRQGRARGRPALALAFVEVGNMARLSDGPM